LYLSVLSLEIRKHYLDLQQQSLHHPLSKSNERSMLLADMHAYTR
jgi:hypothetical protein